MVIIDQHPVNAPLIPALIIEGIKRAKMSESERIERECLTLDEILQRDKKSYAVPYENMEWIRLSKRTSRWKFGGDPKLEIKLKGICIHRNLSGNFEVRNVLPNQPCKDSETSRFFILTDAKFKELFSILPNLAGLNGKFVG